MEVLQETDAKLQKSGKSVQYDESCRNILSNKYILANILQQCVPEYRNSSIAVIAEKYIEGTITPATVGVDADCTNVPPHIVGAANDDVTVTEGNIRYDIRFDAIAPNEDEMIHLIINIEAQKQYNPGYPLIKRAVYYASRLISAQKGKYWYNSDFDKICKVYTIWICMNPPTANEGFINSYEIKEKQIFGNTKLSENHFNLLNIVMVGLSSEETNNTLVDMLSTILSKRATIDERRAAFENNQVPYVYELEKEVINMCNLSQGLIEEGRAEGLVEGRAEGRYQGLIESAHALMQRQNITFEVAVDLLGIAEEDVKRMKELLQN